MLATEQQTTPFLSSRGASRPECASTLDKCSKISGEMNDFCESLAPSLLCDSGMKRNCSSHPIPVDGPEMVVKKTGKVGIFEKLSPSTGPLEEWTVTIRFADGEVGTFKRSEVERLFC